MRQLGQFFDFYGLGEIGAQPGYGFRDAVHTGIFKDDLGDTDTSGTAEQTDQDLIDDERSEQFGIIGLRHQLNQPRRCAEDAGVGRSDAHCAALLNPG